MKPSKQEISDVMRYLSSKGSSRGGKARQAQLTPEERQELTSKAGKARNKALTVEERSEIARKAVQARWAKARKRKG